MRKICVFTGTRAEYGLLKPLMEKIQNDTEMVLQIIASGAHLAPSFGLTYKSIESDGFKIDEKVEMVFSSDSTIGICKSAGAGLMSYGEGLERLSPDILVLLGDRYETLAMAFAATICNCPIAHIHGGEITLGAVDDAFRHAITKLSHLHFTSAEDYAKRVVQLGEDPSKVFNTGALGVENIMEIELLSREKLEGELGFSLGAQSFLVTFHPVTLEKNRSGDYFRNLLDAIDCFPRAKVVFTKANADAGGLVINRMIDAYVAGNQARAVAFTSMGQLRYLSAMKYAGVVLGNSSSGIIEAPSFQVPTVNIGNRQKGRIRARSVIDCTPEKDEIRNALQMALDPGFLAGIKHEKNPYWKKETSLTMKRILKSVSLTALINKKFCDLQ